jgi:hypothetical protein
MHSGALQGFDIQRDGHHWRRNRRLVGPHLDEERGIEEECRKKAAGSLVHLLDALGLNDHTVQQPSMIARVKRAYLHTWSR